jgi:hypothetical protein
LSRDVAQLVSTQEQNSRELNPAMIRLADTQVGIARLLGSLDEDRPTILRKLHTIEGKVDSLVQRQGCYSRSSPPSPLNIHQATLGDTYWGIVKMSMSVLLAAYGFIEIYQ